MAKIISVAWTAPAVRARVKTCTRRSWPDSYAALFRKGDIVQLYDKTPRAGGKLICLAKLTADPVKIWTGPLPIGDWENEGFDYLTEHGFTCGKLTPKELVDSWIANPDFMWVIRFEYILKDKEVECLT
jgi:hypothetical protein